MQTQNTIPTVTIQTFAREIRYSRLDHDFTATLNGQYVGSYPSYLEAEIALDKLVFGQLTHA